MGYPIELLRDDFVSFDTNKWNVSGPGSENATGGELTLDSTNGAISIGSVLDYDLVSSFAFVKLVSVTTTGNSSNFFSISTNGGDFYWQYDLGDVRVNLAGFSGFIPSLTFPVWTKIRESAGVVYADYSFDGSTWTNLDSLTLLGALELTDVGFAAFDYPSSAQIVLSNFNC